MILPASTNKGHRRIEIGRSAEENGRQERKEAPITAQKFWRKVEKERRAPRRQGASKGTNEHLLAAVAGGNCRPRGFLCDFSANRHAFRDARTKGDRWRSQRSSGAPYSQPVCPPAPAPPQIVHVCFSLALFSRYAHSVRIKIDWFDDEGMAAPQMHPCG